MIYCSVNGCMSNNKFDNSRHFFKFPKKTLLKTKQWESFCRDPAGFKLCPKGKRFICDLHFKESDFEESTNVTTDKPVLKFDVIPSLNGPNSIRKKLHKDEKIITPVQHGSDVEFIDHPDSPKEQTPNPTKATPLSNIGDQDSNNSTHVEDQNVSSGNKDNHFKIPIRKHHKFTPIKKGPYLRPPQSGPVSKYCSTGKNLKAKFEIQIHQETMKDNLNSAHENHNTDDHTFRGETSSIFKRARKVCVSNDENDPLREVSINLSSSVVFSADEDNSVQDDSEIPTSPSAAIDEEIDVDTPHFPEETKNSSQQQAPNETFDDGLEHTQTITITKPLKNPLTAQGENIKLFRKGRFVKQYGKTSNRTKLLGIPLDDPKFSIAAAVDSLGSFDALSSELFEHVDVDAGEWHKLYTSNGFSFPKMPKEMIGSMVNQLRAKLPMLKARDQLEVLFLLSMMSIYPSVPKEIQDLLHQRLNLVYIALMFKWETALALATRHVDIPKPKDLNNMPSEDNVDDGFQKDPCSTSDILKSAINSNPTLTQSKKTSNSQNKKRNIKRNISSKVLWKGSNLVPPPLEDSIEVSTSGEDRNKTKLNKKCFAFEIIVHDKNVNNK